MRLSGVSGPRDQQISFANQGGFQRMMSCCHRTALRHHLAHMASCLVRGFCRLVTFVAGVLLASRFSDKGFKPRVTHVA